MMFTEERPQLACFGQSGSLREYLAVVCSALAGEQRMQSEDARICSSAEGERSQRMRTPSQAAQHAAGIPLDRRERGVEGRAADGVIDDVEALTRSVSGNVFLD